MDFPPFDGKSDPLAFINQCETYFNRERIMEEEKVWMASRNLAEDARMWFLQVQRDEGTPAWRRFTKLLHLRFGSPPRSNLLHHVSPAANDTSRLFADVFTQLDRLRARLQAKDKEDREHLVAVRLQAAARGFLSRRRMQSLEKSGRERLAAVRLQAAARGFLARHATRKLRAAIQPTLLAPAHHLHLPPPPATLFVAPTTPYIAPTTPAAAAPTTPSAVSNSSPRTAPTMTDLAKLINSLTAPTSESQGQVAALPQELSVWASFPGSRGSGHSNHQGDQLAARLFPWDPGRCRLLPRPVTIQLEGELGLQGRGRCHGQPAGCHRDGRRSQPKGPRGTVPREQYPPN